MLEEEMTKNVALRKNIEDLAKRWKTTASLFYLYIERKNFFKKYTKPAIWPILTHKSPFFTLTLTPFVAIFIPFLYGFGSYFHRFATDA